MGTDVLEMFMVSMETVVMEVFRVSMGTVVMEVFYGYTLTD